MQLDPSKLVNRQISLDDISTAVDRHNANLPTGTLWGANQAFTVQANGQLNNAAEYRPLIVAFRNGSPVRLQDLGRVIDSVQDDRNLSLYNMRRSIMLQVNRMVFGRPDWPRQDVGVPLTCRIAVIAAVLPVIVLGVYIPSPVHSLLQLAARQLGGR